MLRETLEAASKNDSIRNAVQQKIGDYWAACMDESGIEAAGLKPLQPELDRIAALKSKKEHHAGDRASAPSISGSVAAVETTRRNAPFFGFTGQQDYDDASKVVAQIDQGGLSLPNRDYYLKTDDKSKELLGQISYPCAEDVRSGGRAGSQAAADAGTVIELETAMARRRWTTSNAAIPRTSTTK